MSQPTDVRPKTPQAGPPLPPSPAEVFAAVPLTPALVDRAYPLLRPVAAGLSLAEWQSFCRAVTEPAGGSAQTREDVTVVRGASGHLRALAVHRVHDHPDYGLLLDVPIAVVAAGFAGEPAAASLGRALARLVHDRNCGGLRLWAMSGGAWAARLESDRQRRTDHGLYLAAPGGMLPLSPLLDALLSEAPLG